jgi:K+-transporting ATPase c subunit
MKMHAIVWPCVVTLIGLTGVARAAVPSQLQGKTISVSWAQTVNGVNGGSGTLSKQFRETIYISGQGRIFNRADQRDRSYARTNDRALGSVESFRFERNQLVSTSGWISGANRMTISFDPGFQSCSASLQIGRESGKLYKWKGVDGEIRTATGVMASTPACSIREGNSLAE